LRYLQIDERGARGVLSTSTRDDLGSIEAELGALASALGPALDGIELRGDLAMVSLVGAGLEERHDTVAAALEILDEAEIPSRGIRTDGQSLALLVPGRCADLATARLHAALCKR
jgi:aspartate kinase